MYILTNMDDGTIIKIREKDPCKSFILQQLQLAGYSLTNITHKYKIYFPDGTIKIMNEKEQNENNN